MSLLSNVISISLKTQFLFRQVSNKQLPYSPSVPLSTRFVCRKSTTLTNYNQASCIAIRRPPLSNRARRHQKNHSTTFGCTPDHTCTLTLTDSAPKCTIVLHCPSPWHKQHKKKHTKNSPCATIQWCANVK